MSRKVAKHNLIKVVRRPKLDEVRTVAEWAAKILHEIDERITSHLFQGEEGAEDHGRPTEDP